MRNILVNGFSAKMGGGKALFEDFLQYLVDRRQRKNNRYFVITPNAALYSDQRYDGLKIVPVSVRFQHPLWLPSFYLGTVPAVIRRHNIDVIFNFGDVLLPVRKPQVYFFDWPYAAYPHSLVWSRMDGQDFVRRRIKYVLIKYMIRSFSSITIVQTPSMANQLRTLYGLEVVKVIPSPLPEISSEIGNGASVYVPEDRRLLLCLATFAPHKNHEILLPVAELLKNADSNATILVTFDLDESPKAQELMHAVERRDLDGYLTNLGHVPAELVPSLLKKCDALLLPTLLESYGLPYLEAMRHECTIITSDFDFTRDVCQDAAYYFDPMDPKSIFDAIHVALGDDDVRRAKIMRGLEIVDGLNSRQSAFEKYEDFIAEACEHST